MPDSSLLAPTENQANTINKDPIGRRRRYLALALVLAISFAHFIVSSTYYLIRGTEYAGPPQHQIRLLSALIGEATSLLLLWYVLSEQKRGWKDIGWSPKWADIPQGIGVVLLALVSSVVVIACFQVTYRAVTGHYLPPRSFQNLFGFGISVLSIAFVVVNPFFEELLVRGYTMSEILDLGGSRNLAILVSVVVQMSYHTYQGLLSGIGLTVIFTVFSVYFSTIRKIAPVILAHLCFDAWAMMRGHF